MRMTISYRMFCVVGVVFVFTSIARAAADLPRPLPEHPGNIFLSDESVTVPLPPKSAGKWKLVDYDNKTVRDDLASADKIELGKLPVGYYELRGEAPAQKVSIGVIAPLAAPTAKTSPIGIDVGMAWLYPDEPHQHQVVSLCKISGMNWVRDRMSWPELESAPGVFAPPNRYDRSAEIQTAAGLNVLQVNHIGPPWNKNGKRFPDDLRDAFRFYKEMAKRFKGKLAAMEPWNEADIDMFGGHTGSEMASMQKASFFGLRAGNPDLIACQNVFAIARPETLLDFTANKAGPYFDRFDVHHYVALNRYEEYYALYRAASAGKPMWVTEFNVTVDWSGDPAAQEPDEKNLHIQALRVPKVFTKTLFEGVQAQFYFMLPHYVEYQRQYGLLHRDMTPRPAFMALAAVGRLLADAKAVGRWTSEDKKLHAYVFRAKPDGQEKFVIVAWSGEGDKTINLNVPTEKLYDELGREMKGSWVGQVTLANAPVYAVTSVDPSGALKLDPPPAAPPVDDGKPCPAVLQVLWPDAARQESKSLYQVHVNHPTTVPMFAYNFSDRPVKGELKIEPPTDWKASIAESSIELKPNDRREIPVTISSASAAATTQPIKITGDFGEAGQQILSFNVGPTTQPVK